jgi:hypothetical protein
MKGDAQGPKIQAVDWNRSEQIVRGISKVLRIRVDADQEEQRRTTMDTSRLTLADEIAEIQAEIQRLKRREAALQGLADSMPPISVFRPKWPALRKPAPVSISA